MATSQLVRPNPALTGGMDRVAPARASEETMSINGTVHATAVFLFVVIAAALFGANYVSGAVGLGSMLIALVIGIYTSFRPQHAQYTGLAYAVFEGLAVGVISRSYQDAYSGIVPQAAGLTVAILTGLLLVYRTGKIKVTDNFRLGVSAAVSGIALFYLVTIGASLFGFNMPLVNSSSPLGIGFSVLVVVLASATLVVDFDFIERGVEQGLPRNMNWFAAFGLMVSIIWLYLELLRLLSKLQSRN